MHHILCQSQELDWEMCVQLDSKSNQLTAEFDLVFQPAFGVLNPGFIKGAQRIIHNQAILCADCTYTLVI